MLAPSTGKPLKRLRWSAECEVQDQAEQMTLPCFTGTVCGDREGKGEQFIQVKVAFIFYFIKNYSFGKF